MTVEIVAHSSVHAKTEVVRDLPLERFALYFCLLTVLRLHNTSALLVLYLDFPDIELLDFGESDLAHELLYL